MSPWATSGRLFVLALPPYFAVHRLGRRGYQPWHPVVPGLGVGLAPILQPLVVLPLVFRPLARSESAAREAG